jgi:hypothetical protein
VKLVEALPLPLLLLLLRPGWKVVPALMGVKLPCRDTMSVSSNLPYWHSMAAAMAATVVCW